MSQKPKGDSDKVEKQLRLIEKYTNTQNVKEFTEFLTNEPDILVQKLEKNIRNAILLVLLTEIARNGDNSEIIDLIKYLLSKRREKAKFVIKEPFEEVNNKPLVKEDNTKQVKEVGNDRFEEGHIELFKKAHKEKQLKSIEKELITFLEDEWPTFGQDK